MGGWNWGALSSVQAQQQPQQSYYGAPQQQQQQMNQQAAQQQAALQPQQDYYRAAQPQQSGMYGLGQAQSGAQQPQPRGPFMYGGAFGNMPQPTQGAMPGQPTQANQLQAGTPQTDPRNAWASQQPAYAQQPQQRPQLPPGMSPGAAQGYAGMGFTGMGQAQQSSIQPTQNPGWQSAFADAAKRLLPNQQPQQSLQAGTPQQSLDAAQPSAFFGARTGNLMTAPQYRDNRVAAAQPVTTPMMQNFGWGWR